MKKITSALLMLGLFTIFNVSCKKDDDNKPNSEEDLRSTKMTYKVDGTSKTSTHLFAVLEDGSLGVYGGINDSEAVILGIDDFDGTGDYPIGQDEDIAVITYTTGGKTYISTEGIIKVTSSNSSEVKGTFSGTVQEFQGGASKVITDGKFEAKIIDDPED